MGRRKIEIKAIKDDRNRSVTFLKRKGGLFKKAHELSVLCSVDVAVIIFGHNKKLYEFSSGDIQETIGRYNYYGQPHEHKGPNDFRGKGGDDDDDDEDDEDAGNAREDSAPPQSHPQMIPPHLQHQNSYPHLRHQAPSASPPMQNGMFQQRHGTPQPHMGSRPSSRNAIRRTSSNLVPIHNTPPPQPAQNGFAYMPNPSIYNPHANPNMQQPPQRSPQPQFHQFSQNRGPTPQQHPPAPPPPQQHPHMQQAHDPYMQEPRRPAMPPNMPSQDHLQPPPSHPIRRTTPQPEQQQPRAPQEPTPPRPKHLSSKSRSIFTPIDEGGSVLAQHFFGSAQEPARSIAKAETQPDIKPPPRSNPQITRSIPVPPRTLSLSSDFQPPSRTNTNGSKSGGQRPKLNLQIPSEASDAESEAAGSSPNPSVGPPPHPVRASSDPHHSSGPILPPPSPSASALLSAGATGPPNPFARPPPPGSQAANANAYNDNRNNIETPISALPSRFMGGDLLPSPSQFYPEWGFGSARDSNMLPSPLTFPTPVMATGPGFGRGDNAEKRKGSEERLEDAKKVKT